MPSGPKKRNKYQGDLLAGAITSLLSRLAVRKLYKF